MQRIRRWALRAAGAGALATAALLAYLGYIHATGNFHAVVEGEVYRAAQVTPELIADHRARQGIRSILNLRGASEGAAWYDAEIAASRDLGIIHADFAMSASQEITAVEAQRLIAVMRSLPTPLLIHCRHGSDRTGLAAALYLGAILRTDEATAEGQLSVRFGHFAVPWVSAGYPMYATWERLEPLLGFDGS